MNTTVFLQIIAAYVNSHKELGEVQAILSDVQEVRATRTAS